ncbi:MAG TPA: ABC transporter permease [Chloroflexota bacterium]|nr:ABC transporter permease [Chloroflexota bacterium]
MATFALRRLIQAIPTFFGITLITFALIRLAPGDPLSLLVFGATDLTAEDYAALRRSYGLDQPIPVQYLSWLGRTLSGDFGQSFLYRRPVIQMIAASLPNTLQLSALALLVAVVVGVPLGVIAARYRGTFVDQLIRILSVAGHAIPPFWFGLLFILVLSVQFHLFPVGGMLTIGKGEWDIADRLAHLVGPVLTLSLVGIANYSRYMRTETLDILGQDFIRTAQAKGLRERTVLYVHALRNALLPIITALGGLLAFLISGSVVVEQVFAWPGMGRMTFEAARSKDYPIVMAVVVISSALLLVSYILRDVAYGVADPRVRRS